MPPVPEFHHYMIGSKDTSFRVLSPCHTRVVHIPVSMSVLPRLYV